MFGAFYSVTTRALGRVKLVEITRQEERWRLMIQEQH